MKTYRTNLWLFWCDLVLLQIYTKLWVQYIMETICMCITPEKRRYTYLLEVYYCKNTKMMNLNILKYYSWNDSSTCSTCWVRQSRSVTSVTCSDATFSIRSSSSFSYFLCLFKPLPSFDICSITSMTARHASGIYLQIFFPRGDIRSIHDTRYYAGYTTYHSWLFL